jgi:hypothetical protein
MKFLNAKMLLRDIGKLLLRQGKIWNLLTGEIWPRLRKLRIASIA